MFCLNEKAILAPGLASIYNLDTVFYFYFYSYQILTAFNKKSLNVPKW
jgi:hypothetical protein